MKTKEELNALKKELEAMNEKLQALSEDELAQVAGGMGFAGLVNLRHVPEYDAQMIGLAGDKIGFTAERPNFDAAIDQADMLAKKRPELINLKTKL